MRFVETHLYEFELPVLAMLCYICRKLNITYSLLILYNMHCSCVFVESGHWDWQGNRPSRWTGQERLRDPPEWAVQQHLHPPWPWLHGAGLWPQHQGHLPLSYLPWITILLCQLESGRKRERSIHLWFISKHIFRLTFLCSWMIIL